ncbi:tetratricopeptide repeat protein [Sedimentitalea sp. JM2-8]|uniref:Tetratricopeptide repeat protein n=1 Tax=Sedimentitalea xiamensis TaxID=3050037 RepID=A0ABT7FGU5_9RHOB|nr:tetratricopeptide repeat protein [Sedimentitalea xiamensis]MDK3074307.1 tetratricopeptide repeat protein [Sedimentitalea xiamensis]
MVEDKPASVLPRMLQRLVAARDIMLSNDPDFSTPIRARMSLASALSALGADAEAIPLYDSVLAEHPSYPAAEKARAKAVLAAGLADVPDFTSRLEQARSCLKQGRLSDAQDAFDRILVDDPENQPAQIGCIDVALRKGDLSRAIALARQGLERLPDNIPFGLRLAQGLQRKGHIVEAIDLFEDMRRRAPDHPRTGISLARAYLDTGRLSEAQKIVGRILSETPGDREALLLQIDMAKAVNDLDETLHNCDVALEHHPDDRTFLDRKAHVLMRCARPLEALAILKRLCANAPDDGPLQARTARACLAAGRVDDAQRILRQAPASIPVTLLLAEMEEQAGDIDVALQRLAPHVDSDASATPDATSALVVKFCTLCLRNGQVDRARCALASADIEVENLQPIHLLQLMQVAAKMDANEIMTVALDSALSRDAIPHPLAMHILRLVQSAGRPDLTDRARDMLEQRVSVVQRAAFRIESDALTLGPDAAIARARASGPVRRNPDSARALASALLQTGNCDLLLRYLSLCRHRWPSDPDFAIHQANALGELGQPEEALAVLDELASVDAPLNIMRRRLRILYESGRLAEAEKLLETAGNPPAMLLSPIIRLLLNIARDRIDAALALASDVATQIAGDHSTAARFSVTHIGALLNEARIYKLARGTGPSAAQVDPKSLQRSFFLPAKQAIDRNRPEAVDAIPTADHSDIPRQVFQYWNTDPAPDEVTRIMSTWQSAPGYRHCLMNRNDARAFLRDAFDAEHERAFRMANHVAEECDFLRLCVLLARGGIYADADDRLIGDPEVLRRAGRGMVLLREPVGAIANNLLLARPGHPLLQIAVDMARDSLLARENDNTWSKTGPGLLTRATAAYLSDTSPDEVSRDLTLLPRYLGQRVVQFHVRLPYKTTQVHWNMTAGALPLDIVRMIERDLAD